MRLLFLALVLLISAICTSLTIAMVSPSSSPIKTKISPLFIEERPEEIPEFSSIALEKATQENVIAFCLEKLAEGHETLFKRGVLFYAKHFDDLARLKNEIEKNLIKRLEMFKDDPHVLSQIGYWLDNENENFHFIARLNQSLYKLWTEVYKPARASKLSHLLMQRGESEFLSLQNITQRAFDHAYNNDHVRTLLFILPLMRQLQCEPCDSRLISNNFLEDAEFLYKEARLSEAYDKVSIALFINQDNIKAHLLAQKIEERIEALQELTITCLESPDSVKNTIYDD